MSGPDPAAARWTRVNIGEAIPGVPTPLTWSVWQPAMEHGFWDAQVRLGVAARTEYGRAPVTTLALGRPAISVDVVVEQVGRMPGADPAAFAEQYFGLPRDGGASDGSDRGQGRGGHRARTLARVATRAPWSAATIGRAVRRESAMSSAHWSAVAFGPAPADPVAVLADAAARFRATMAVHTLQGTLAQAAFERLQALAGDLTAALTTSDDDLAETEVAADLWALGTGRLDVDGFVRRHGYHGPDEGELAARSWREDPTPVLAAAAAYAAVPDRAPDALRARRAGERAGAEAELRRRLPATRRPAARALVVTARRLLLLRELGKAAFLRHLDVARRAARAIGDDAMWCTLDELRTGSRPDIGARVAERAGHQAVDLPLSWIGEPVPTVGLAAAGAAPVVAGVVTGVGASPGRLRGRARVVLDAGAAIDPIGPDEVLVARATDPSWVALFVTAGALVIDVGGDLSHAAIVARELGVPCVIGTGDGTARIPDGALVEVDGARGTATIVG